VIVFQEAVELPGRLTARYRLSDDRRQLLTLVQTIKQRDNLEHQQFCPID